MEGIKKKIRQGINEIVVKKTNKQTNKKQIGDNKKFF